jgi:hypothetical protein
MNALKSLGNFAAGSAEQTGANGFDKYILSTADKQIVINCETKFS